MAFIPVDIYIDDINSFRPDSDSESESQGEILVDHPNGDINSNDSSYKYDVPENIQLDDYQLEHGVGHRQLVRNGYIYKLNRQTSAKMYWICKHQGCTATVHTDKTDNYLQSNGEHNHLIEPEELEVQLFRIALKDRVINETAPIPKIFDEEIAKARFSPNALANVPMFRDI
ncbi:unnamed protein product, partial [Adineta ricciae]